MLSSKVNIVATEELIFFYICCAHNPDYEQGEIIY